MRPEDAELVRKYFFSGVASLIVDDETHDEGYIGHFRLRSIEFSRSRLLLEIARDRNNRIEVTFDIGLSEFEEVRRVIDTISGKSSPDDEDAL